MEEIGFTDEELQKLEDKQVRPPNYRRTKLHSAKHTRNPNSVPVGASLSKSVQSTENAAKQKEFLQQFNKSTGSNQRVVKSNNTNNTIETGSTDNRSSTNENTANPSSTNENTANPSSTNENTANLSSTNENTANPSTTNENTANPSTTIENTANRTTTANTTKKQDGTPVFITKLEVLQRAQAELEEKNRVKQDELNKNISAKFAKTSQQAKLLADLKKEVSSLEKEMTADISILRDKIDHSNRRYYDARKRYETAEAEFVAAKLDLHHSKELKEGLQEHLFTIIKLSETKKFNKLEELNKKLEKLNNG